jgi:hypothetical protein
METVHVLCFDAACAKRGDVIDLWASVMGRPGAGARSSENRVQRLDNDSQGARVVKKESDRRARPNRGVLLWRGACS